MRPHHFIFNREWYEKYGGTAQFAEYQKEFSRLTSDDRAELLNLISSVDPRHLPNQVKLAEGNRVKSILRHHLSLAKNEESAIWAAQRAMKQQPHPSVVVPDEERVEDAGLNYEDNPIQTVVKIPSRKRAMAVA